MKLIFAGTPEFAAVALRALLNAGHDIPLVLSQPDRPAGRGLKLEPTPVKKESLKQNLKVEQPLTLKSAEAVQRLRDANADAMVVAAYGLILPKNVLSVPPLGCLNIHASLLPRWRGAAPIQRAILAGDAATGITIMQMDEGLDTGDMLLQEAVAIGAEETAGELHDRLAALGARLICDALDSRPAPVRQDAAFATYAAKIVKTEAVLDWNQDAESVHRRIRAFNPVPGAVTMFEGERIKIWRATPVAANFPGAPGVVMRAAPGQLVVGCGSGALSLLELQRAGARRMATPQFLSGFPIATGTRFGSVGSGAPD